MTDTSRDRRALTLALAGNPNTGKSTLFNAITGLAQHVGNWPGKTVDRYEGRTEIRGRHLRVVDLPGTYSLWGSTIEETIAGDYMVSGYPDVVVLVVDASNLERNLYLVLQAMELTDRLVVALNMMDVVRKNRWHMDEGMLEDLLGVPVVPISAARRQGLDRLLHTAMDLATGRLRPRPRRDLGPEAEERLPGPDEDGARREAVLDVLRAGRVMHGSANGSEVDVHARMVEHLYGRAADIASRALEKTEVRDLTERIDGVVTHPLWALPFMLAILGVVLALTIVVAEPIADFLDGRFTALAHMAGGALAGAPVWIRGPVVDGLIVGVGAVISVMLPTMAIFFVLFALLEDSGLIPRVAFIMDRPFEKVGSQGRHCLTSLMGLGCNIPGVMSTRIMDGGHRLVAIVTNGLVPCNGRLGIIIPLAALFFGRSATLVVLGLMAMSMAAVFVSCLVLTRTVIRDPGSGFVLEMPPYRIPQVVTVTLKTLKHRVWHVLWRASVVAAPMTVLIWVLASYPAGGGFAATYTGRLITALDPVGRFIGLDGHALLATAFAFPAKEIVLGSLAITHGLSTTLAGTETVKTFLLQAWSPLTALVFLVFYTFSLPCAYTSITIYRETRSWKWTAWGTLLPLAVAIILALAVHRAGLVLGLG